MYNVLSKTHFIFCRKVICRRNAHFYFIIVDKLTHTTCYIVTYFLCLRQKHLIQKNVCSSVLCFFLNIVRCRIKEMILFWSLIFNMITTHPAPPLQKKKFESIQNNYSQQSVAGVKRLMIRCTLGCNALQTYFGLLTYVIMMRRRAKTYSPPPKL